VIRIHRAKKIDENSKYNPIPGANNREDYPLQFEFQQFWSLEAVVRLEDGTSWYIKIRLREH